MPNPKTKSRQADSFPKEVKLAMRLLLTSLMTGAIAGILRPITLPEGVPKIVQYQILFLILLVNGYVYYSIYLKRNWARVLFVVLTVAGLPLTITSWPNTFVKAPISGLFDILTILIQLIAVYLLFQRNSKCYFLAKK